MVGLFLRLNLKMAARTKLLDIPIPSDAGSSRGRSLRNHNQDLQACLSRTFEVHRGNANDRHRPIVASHHGIADPCEASSRPSDIREATADLGIAIKQVFEAVSCIMERENKVC